jgi:hypothetical protein
MLAYVRCSDAKTIFPEARAPMRIPGFRSTLTPLPDPANRRRSADRKVIYLITEMDIRRHVLSGKSLAQLCEVSLAFTVGNVTSAWLHTQLTPTFGQNVHLWRVAGQNLPANLLPNSQQSLTDADLTLFVEPPRATDAGLPSRTKIAFIFFFFPNATPKVQFVAATPFDPNMPVGQLFPLIRERVGLEEVDLKVFSLEPEVRKMPEKKRIAAIDWIQGSFTIVVAEVTPAQPKFLVHFAEEARDPVISYFSMIRPNGDRTVEDFIERRRPQLLLEICQFSDPECPSVLATVPETMSVTELPAFVAFATQEHVGSSRSIEIFIGDRADKLAHHGPIDLTDDVTADDFFDERGRSGSVRLVYAIVPCPANTYQQMVIRTCEVYDTPIHLSKRIRVPMPRDHTLAQLVGQIRSVTGITEKARLLLDEKGLIRPLGEREVVPATALLRFERIPRDQIAIGTGEFLVRALFCRAPSHDLLTKTFMFKILPGELAKDALHRIWAYHFFDTALLSNVKLQRRETTLTMEKAVDSRVDRTDVLMIVLLSRDATAGIRTNGNWVTVIYPLGDAY